MALDKNNKKVPYWLVVDSPTYGEVIYRAVAAFDFRLKKQYIDQVGNEQLAILNIEFRKLSGSYITETLVKDDSASDQDKDKYFMFYAPVLDDNKLWTKKDSAQAYITANNYKGKGLPIGILLSDIQKLWKNNSFIIPEKDQIEIIESKLLK